MPTGVVCILQQLEGQDPPLKGRIEDPSPTPSPPGDTVHATKWDIEKNHVSLCPAAPSPSHSLPQLWGPHLSDPKGRKARSR